MTNEGLRIAVAEARGYVKKRCTERDAGGAIHRYTGWFNESEYGDIDVKLPDYPNSMDDCRELLEEMMDKNILLKIQVLPRLEDMFYVAAYGANARKLLTNIMSDSLPVAICKVYLAWKGEQ